MAKQFPNKFGARCHKCNAWVPEQAGLCERNTGDGPKWLTSCAPTCDVIADEPVKKATFPPTEEQLTAKAKFAAGETFALQAFAGAGKTSTFILLAESTGRSCQYIAYNAAIAAEAGSKFPRNCATATLHSIARRQIGSHYESRLDKDARRLSPTEVARRLDLEPFFYNNEDGEQRVVQPNTLAGYVQKAVAWFCTTADTVPSVKHVQYVDGLDPIDPDTNKRTYTNNNLLREHIARAIDIAWDDIVDENGSLRFTHDHYLKIWELGIWGDPKIPGEVIFFDEAQDANPVFISAVQKQSAQVVWCGDSNQAIYEWRGAVDALNIVEVESTAYLTQSFRFGPEIAEVANKILAQLDSFDPTRPLIGSGKPGTVGPCSEPDAVLCRTNAGAIGVVLDCISRGRSVHLVGGGGEVLFFAKAARDLQQKGSTSHPDLVIFDSWAEVQQYVDNEPQGDDLKVLVKLIDQYGVDEVIKAASNKVTEEDADVVVSTAHKSKGRQWPSVQLHNDFIESDGAEENRLRYVAATRAQEHLDYSLCAPVLKIVEGKEDL